MAKDRERIASGQRGPSADELTLAMESTEPLQNSAACLSWNVPARPHSTPAPPLCSLEENPWNHILPLALHSHRHRSLARPPRV